MASSTDNKSTAEVNKSDFDAPSYSHHGKGVDIALYLGIAGGAVLLIAMSILLILCGKKKKIQKNIRNYVKERTGGKEAEIADRLEKGEISGRFTDLAFDFRKNTYTYDELVLAAGGFSEANLLGEGGFGKVYRGVLSNGKEIAIKVLKEGSSQGDKHFRAEINTLSRIHHRHLLSLIGYCVAGAERLLVYPYIPNGTLEHHLHANDANTLDWATRLKIAIGTAKGLQYLHEDCQPGIVHRDVKAANILINDNLEPKIADFGLSKLLGESFTQPTYNVMGTSGYMAPEYHRNGNIAEKVDVYAFGVILLELLTGKKPVICEEETLVDWARPILKKALDNGDFRPLLDRRISSDYDPIRMTSMIGCADAAIQKASNMRPRMSKIALALEGLITLHEMNGSVLTDHITRPYSAG